MTEHMKITLILTPQFIYTEGTMFHHIIHKGTILFRKRHRFSMAHSNVINNILCDRSDMTVKFCRQLWGRTNNESGSSLCCPETRIVGVVLGLMLPRLRRGIVIHFIVWGALTRTDISPTDIIGHYLLQSYGVWWCPF